MSKLHWRNHLETLPLGRFRNTSFRFESYLVVAGFVIHNEGVVWEIAGCSTASQSRCSILNAAVVWLFSYFLGISNRLEFWIRICNLTTCLSVFTQGYSISRILRSGDFSWVTWSDHRETLCLKRWVVAGRLTKFEIDKNGNRQQHG